MPEGDTIYRAARALERALGGRVCTGFETGLATLARVDDETPIAGRRIERVEAKGKWLSIHFSGNLILLTHMRMSGSWHIYKPGERWMLGRNRMRVVVRTAEYVAVAFDVPVAEFHTARSLERNTELPRLGLDVLSEQYSVAAGVARLEAYGELHPEAEIGVVLLNQRVLAGLGNVYKSEVAFAAGVNPFRAMRTLTRHELETMAEAAARWMKVNVADGAGDGIVTYTGNRRTTGRSSRDERLWVYGRAGEECRRCGAAVTMRKQGAQARVTFWCPECQPMLG